MKSLPSVLKQFLVIASVSLAMPFSAQGEAPPNSGHERCTGPMPPPPDHDREGMMHEGMFLMEGMGAPDGDPPFLHGVTLTESQQDKIFSIMHAAMPLLREQSKLAHKSADGIRDLETSSQYDEGKLKALADANAHAMAEIMTLRVRNVHQIYLLLTPEQRAQLEEMKAKFDTHHGLRAQIEEMKTKFGMPQGSGDK